MVLHRYRDGDLMQVPCRITSCNAPQWEFDANDDFRTATADGTTYRATHCTVTDVRCEYEYKSVRYESVKFGRNDNFAPGARTVCYL